MRPQRAGTHQLPGRGGFEGSWSRAEGKVRTVSDVAFLRQETRGGVRSEGS